MFVDSFVDDLAYVRDFKVCMKGMIFAKYECENWSLRLRVCEIRVVEEGWSK